MDGVEHKESEIPDTDIGEVSKKYEDFTQEDFKRHLEMNVHSVETNTRVGREFFDSFPVFTIHKTPVEGFVLPGTDPEEIQLNVGQKVRSLFTKRKEHNDAE